jgi:hypothetical protein
LIYDNCILVASPTFCLKSAAGSKFSLDPARPGFINLTSDFGVR